MEAGAPGACGTLGALGLPPRRPPSPSLRCQYQTWCGDGASKVSEPPRYTRFFAEPAPNRLLFPRPELALPSDAKAEVQCRNSLNRLVHSISDYSFNGRVQEPIQGSVLGQLSYRRVRGFDCVPNKDEGKELTRPASSGPVGAANRRSSTGRRLSALGRRSSVILTLGSDGPSLDPDESENTVRALKVLKEAAFFQIQEAEQTGLTAQLSRTVTFTNECAGQVVFRQDDPAQSCYVIVNGTVAVHIFAEPEDTAWARYERSKMGNVEEEYPTPRSEFATYQYSTLTEFRRKEGTVHHQARPAPERFRTTEGFSTFNEESVLGRRVARLGPGAVFGELALKNDLPRAATIRCVNDCEFLVVSKETFTTVLSEILEKHTFFNTHLAGMLTLDYALVHPSTAFKKTTFEAGHVFFREGFVVPEPALFLIRRGSVQFRRFRRASDNRAYLLAQRSLDAPEGRQAMQAEGLCTQGLEGSVGATDSLKDVSREVVWDTLGETAVFSSLSFLPLPTTEPFTVVAGPEGCEAYCCSGAHVEQLPLKLIKGVRKQLLQDVTRRARLLIPDDVKVTVPSLPNGSSVYATTVRSNATQPGTKPAKKSQTTQPTSSWAQPRCPVPSIASLERLGRTAPRTGSAA